MGFKDHFSGHAEQYARHRPAYPAELYQWLAEQTAVHDLAWDCATGNGQAAVGLAAHFQKVVATDASPQQIAHAQVHPRVNYRVEAAEGTSCAEGAVDIVTVAQALHWLELERFYGEVRRVLKPGGVVAAWGYGLARITPKVDAVVADYYEQIREFWPAERSFIEDRYRTLAFPFRELQAPAFDMRVTWALGDLVAYLQTWSATRRATQTLGRELWIIPELRQAWGDEARRRPVIWPMFLRAGVHA